MMLRRDVPEVQQADEYSYICRVSTWLKQAINARRAEAIKSYRRPLHSGLLRLEDAATRAAQARRWDLSVVDVLMQDVDGSTADLLREAGRMVQELAGEDRRNWETRVQNQAMRVMHVASEAYKSLGSRQWTMQEAKLRQQGINTEVYHAQRQVAHIILGHECNLMQPNRMTAGRNSRSKTRSVRGAETSRISRSFRVHGLYSPPEQAD
jgi:hypothetical protein